MDRRYFLSDKDQGDLVEFTNNLKELAEEPPDPEWVEYADALIVGIRDIIATLPPPKEPLSRSIERHDVAAAANRLSEMLATSTPWDPDTHDQRLALWATIGEVCGFFEDETEASVKEHREAFKDMLRTQKWACKGSYKLLKLAVTKARLPEKERRCALIAADKAYDKSAWETVIAARIGPVLMDTITPSKDSEDDYSRVLRVLDDMKDPATVDVIAGEAARDAVKDYAEELRSRTSTPPAKSRGKRWTPATTEQGAVP